MSSTRILKVNELVKKELGKIIVREIEISPDVLLTLTRVDCSPDLRQAKIYMSVIPDEKFQKIFKILLANISELQHLLNRRLRMYPVPKIMFVQEKKTKDAAKIEELLEGLENNA